MRIAFKNTSVHECAGVAFVGVADNILLVSLVCGGKAPFESGRESAAASSAQSGILDYLDNLLGSKLGKALCKSLIAVVCDIFVNVFGVDYAAVAKRDSVLLLIELGFLERLDFLTVDCLIIKKSLDHAALEKMLFNNFGNVFNLDFGIEAAFGINYHNGAESAKTEAAGADNFDFFFKSLCLDFLFKGFNDCR